jgi:serine/threonine protein kinase
MNAKIADFGVSRISQNANKALTSFAGTLAWMAPEIMRSEDTYTSSVDVYAMGMVMFEAVTGDFPFDGVPLPLLAVAVALQGQRPQLSPPTSRGEQMVQNLMVRCWAQDPESRPKCREAIKELQVVLKTIEEAGGNSVWSR